MQPEFASEELLFLLSGWWWWWLFLSSQISLWKNAVFSRFSPKSGRPHLKPSEYLPNPQDPWKPRERANTQIEFTKESPCLRFIKRRLQNLQKSEGNFPNEFPGEFCRGCVGGFIRAFFLGKNRRKNHPKIHGNFQMRIWESQGQSPHCKNPALKD